MLDRPAPSLRLDCWVPHVGGVRRGVAGGGVVAGSGTATGVGTVGEIIGGRGGSWCVSRGS